MLHHLRRPALRIGALLLTIAACGGGTGASSVPRSPASQSASVPSADASTAPRGSGSAAPRSAATPNVVASAEPSTAAASGGEPSASGSEPADTGGSAVSGDVPDNAVFLTYTDPTHGFSIQYVEGWQVQGKADGVLISDKDSSEQVQVVPGQTDAAAYVTSTDLPALQGVSGFSLIKQDAVDVKGHGKLVHLRYHVPSPPDPVTGKSVPSTVDRYYVPGKSGLAVVTLSTPDGVDNVDAFKQMIESLAWTA